eukprot:g5877.t1
MQDATSLVKGNTKKIAQATTDLKEPSTSHSWIQACISDWNISTVCVQNAACYVASRGQSQATWGVPETNHRRCRHRRCHRRRRRHRCRRWRWRWFVFDLDQKVYSYKMSGGANPKTNHRIVFRKSRVGALGCPRAFESGGSFLTLTSKCILLDEWRRGQKRTTVLCLERVGWAPLAVRRGLALH